MRDGTLEFCRCQTRLVGGNIVSLGFTAIIISPEVGVGHIILEICVFSPCWVSVEADTDSKHKYFTLNLFWRINHEPLPPIVLIIYKTSKRDMDI